MGFSDMFRGNMDQYQNQVQNGDPRQASLGHEILAGAAAFEAARMYESHVAANGEPSSHQMRNELLAGFAGAFIDREAETRGMSWVDRQRAQNHAVQQVQAQM